MREKAIFQMTATATNDNENNFLPSFVICFIVGDHSMATANLNKSEELMTDITTASKYIPKRPRISIN